jgi:acetyl esterase/lipase
VARRGAGAEKRHGEAEKVADGVYFSNIHDPSLTVARADPRHANGAAVVIVPGGGHRMLVFQNEGMVAAKTLNRIGVSAFVLKYRLARDQGSAGYDIERDAAADLRRAVRWVRAHAATTASIRSASA